MTKTTKTSGCLCECGCGLETLLSTKTRCGYIKGQPRRTLQGHHVKTRGIQTAITKSYRVVRLPNNRFVPIHRLRAERALGKPLPRGAEVHHMDGTRGDHSPLVICQDKKYHALLHARMRVRVAGGNQNIEALCCTCRCVKPFAAFLPSPRGMGVTSQCRECNSKYLKNYQRKPR